MDAIKQYLPWIVVAIVGFYLLNKLSSGKTTLAPQTQFTETPQGDPFANLRGQAFEVLTAVGIAQTQAETERLQSERESAIASKTLDVASARATQEFDIAGRSLGLQQQSLLNQLRTELRKLDIFEILGLKESETDLAKAALQSETSIAQTSLQSELAKYLQQTQISYNQFLQNSYLQQLELYYQQRDQDRQVQQSAINRITGGSNTAGIIGSISQAIGNIFGGRSGGNVFGTPPTFPSGFNFGGFF